ncbi:ABC transporter permease [Faecalibacterium sp. An122]|uniref:ABC transporter permease n=1 Tax=Faecalibacterium sp. An122 TaxID=1965551 RepID=UPI001FA87CA5|nr:ABC transporter permease [Faecalibacterium sp. An122]
MEALSIDLVLENMKRYLLDGIGAFFAILPITALVARIKKGYWLALVFAELFASMSS